MTGSAPRTVEGRLTLQSRAARWMRVCAMGTVQGLAWLGRPVASLTARAVTPLRNVLGNSKPPASAALSFSDAVAASTAGSVSIADAVPAVVPAVVPEVRRCLLRQTIETTLMPALVARHGAIPQASPAFEVQASQLAQLVLLSRSQAAADLLCEVNAVAESLVHVLSSLVEPAARRLGDLWHNDDCNEFDVAIGLYHLQTAVRRLGVDSRTLTPLRPSFPRASVPQPHLQQPYLPQPCVALLTPQPGEGHVLATALHADLAWRAGWGLQVEFPRTDEALQELLAARRVDLLDLSLSSAFRREHCIERMAMTVARARRASLNPRLVVVVSGRLFQECSDAARVVGADASCRSAAHFRHLLAQTAWRRDT